MFQRRRLESRSEDMGDSAEPAAVTGGSCFVFTAKVPSDRFGPAHHLPLSAHDQTNRGEIIMPGREDRPGPHPRRMPGPSISGPPARDVGRLDDPAGWPRSVRCQLEWQDEPTGQFAEPVADAAPRRSGGDDPRPRPAESPPERRGGPCRMPTRGHDDNLIGAGAVDIVDGVGGVADRAVRIGVDDEFTGLAGPSLGHELGLGPCARYTGPPRENHDVALGCDRRRVGEPLRTDRVQRAAAAVGVAEDDDDPPPVVAHDRRRRTSSKNSSVPVTVATSFTAFTP